MGIFLIQLLLNAHHKQIHLIDVCMISVCISHDKNSNVCNYLKYFNIYGREFGLYDI